MKASAVALSLATLVLLPSLTASAQSTNEGGDGNPSAGQATFVTPAEFVRGLRDGSLALISPGAVREQRRKARQTLRRSRSLVQEFLRKHPDLTDLDQLVHLTPDLKDPSITRVPGGDFNLTFLDNMGETQQVETESMAFKWNDVADAIRSASDPESQLSVYTTLYDAIPPTFAVGEVNSPASLKGASLATIRGALERLVAALDPIVGQLPPPINPIEFPPPSCAGDIGESTTPGVNAPDGALGDQARAVCAASAEGIIGKFTFPDSPYLTCVKSQGHRGTCHIFAAISGVEESIALQFGEHVNLSEQEYMEFANGLWDPSWFSDGGGTDLDAAASHGYRFAYEKQWDYNASPKRVTTPSGFFTDSCKGYPTSEETGCSDTSPQAPIVCAEFIGFSVCGFSIVKAAGAHSPYQSTGSLSIYYPGALDFSVAMMQIGLALNIPVIMAFDVTDDFEPPTNGYVA